RRSEPTRGIWPKLFFATASGITGCESLMSTVDDQIASLLAAAGAADVLERRFASQRDLARNVLRRQTERIARLEQLLATLRERPAPTGSAGAAAAAADAAYPDSAPAWNELTALMRELVRRQEEA